MPLDNLMNCAHCIMDNSDTEIQFDENGVCNHYKSAKLKFKNRRFQNESGRLMLSSTARGIHKYGKNKEYDYILYASGGIDSSYLLHIATNTTHLLRQVVHVDVCWNSRIAVKNIGPLIEALNLDLSTYVVDWWKEMQGLQPSFLKASVTNQDAPQYHAFFANLYVYVIPKNYKCVLTGSNPTSESILSSGWGYGVTGIKHIAYTHEICKKKIPLTYPRMNLFQCNLYWQHLKKIFAFENCEVGRLL